MQSMVKSEDKKDKSKKTEEKNEEVEPDIPGLLGDLDESILKSFRVID